MRILIADDHPLFRRGLRRVLEDNGHEVVAEAVNGAEAERLSHATRPDLVLMDLQMPVVDGVTATRRLAATLSVIVLTVSEDDSDLQHAVAAGARDYLLKRAPPGEILRAVEAVAGGYDAMSPEIAVKAFAALRHQPQMSPLAPLSQRQRQVLAGVAKGQTNREIGASLAISEHTVKTYLERLNEKLGVRSRAELIAIAVRSGLAEQPAAPPQGPAEDGAGP